MTACASVDVYKRQAADLVGYVLRVRLAVAVADEHGLMGVVDAGFGHVVHQRVQALPASAHFLHGNQVAFVIHVQHGLCLLYTSRCV